MAIAEKVLVTCALNGLLTDPDRFQIPVTPEEMAQSAKEAFEAGATIVHVHFRDQRPGKGALPSWDARIADDICSAIRQKVPEIIINMSTGIEGSNIDGPLSCLEKVRPEMASLNSGSLNYLKIKKDGSWAWPPFVFDNPISKIESFVKAMDQNSIIPECECFDTGIVRCIPMFEKAGILKTPSHVSLVMGVASGMPAKTSWLPLLVEELNQGTHWQVIAIGRVEVWDLHRRCIELGGNTRTGIEDTFYLPNGEKTTSNGKLIESLVSLIRDCGREPANPAEARLKLGL